MRYAPGHLKIRVGHEVLRFACRHCMPSNMLSRVDDVTTEPSILSSPCGSGNKLKRNKNSVSLSLGFNLTSVQSISGYFVTAVSDTAYMAAILNGFLIFRSD